MKPLHVFDTEEGKRLHFSEDNVWRRWGPYLSERQWGTVREDYSPNGTAWDSFPHDHARSRAYRWGEDGIAGFSDESLNWCLSLALWNGNDPILKERLFGLTNEEGNHGEDVKELYFYLDGTPTHSYMRMLYKYPHGAFPYQNLVEENHHRGTDAREYEILDTGIFDDNAYFDVVVEYAKAGPDDILMRITVENRGTQAAQLHLLPQLWARNTWSWNNDAAKPELSVADGSVIATDATGKAQYRWESVDGLDVDGVDGADNAAAAANATRTAAGNTPVQWLFCENETNLTKLYGIDAPGPFKDGFNEYLIASDTHAVRHDKGTKVAAHRTLIALPGKQYTFAMRLRPLSQDVSDPTPFSEVMNARRTEADAYYQAVQRGIKDDESRLIQRQALAGLIWSKQFYYFDIRHWLAGDPAQPAPPEERKHGRDADWDHLSNADVISMPDTWEYPWYASWDLAFQAVAFAVIDPSFAKHQLLLLTQDRFMHPNGQLPAYEWAFGDANPPVHAWAVWRVYHADAKITGKRDRRFLERAFHKLLLNFGWWVNRKDAGGRNIFQGGFLGLDNIQIFDRSATLPLGFRIDQSDGTAWMSAYALDMMRIAIELAGENDAYVDVAIKFFEHFLHIAGAMNGVGRAGTSLWDETDQFYYDSLAFPDGTSTPLRVRSVVGLSPLFAVHVMDSDEIEGLPHFIERLRWFLQNRPDLSELVSRWDEPGTANSALLSLLRGHRMKKILVRMLDEAEFLSDYGVRALSRSHLQPYTLEIQGKTFGMEYAPAESITNAFGGNSNWRGPIWMPINYLLIESLREFHRYYGEDFKIEYPTGSGTMCSLREIADGLAARLCGLFRKGTNGIRPVMATYPKLAADPRSSDLILFHEYFDGDNGRGVGASHQTGWTALIALLLDTADTTNISDTLDNAAASRASASSDTVPDA